MADVNYQLPMQLMELLGLRGWEASQPRTYWGLKRPDGMSDAWTYPNVGAGGGGSWGYQGGYGTTTGGGGGYGSSTGIGGGAGAGASLASLLAGRNNFSEVGDASTAPSNAGVGMNATTDNFGDFLGALTTGPSAAFGSFIGQALANGIAGQPGRQITGLGMTDLLGAARNAIGGSSGDGNGVSGPGNFGSGNVNAAMDINKGDYLGAALDLVGVNPTVSDMGYQGDNGFGGVEASNASQGAGPQTESADFAKGGAVTLNRLIGPNPPGPDDGYAALDAGEHVLTADDVQRLGGHAGVMRLRELLRR